MRMRPRPVLAYFAAGAPNRASLLAFRSLSLDVALQRIIITSAVHASLLQLTHVFEPVSSDPSELCERLVSVLCMLPTLLIWYTGVVRGDSEFCKGEGVDDGAFRGGTPHSEGETHACPVPICTLGLACSGFQPGLASKLASVRQAFTSCGRGSEAV